MPAVFVWYNGIVRLYTKGAILKEINVSKKWMWDDSDAIINLEEKA
jgi:hypothetical protein